VRDPDLWAFSWRTPVVLAVALALYYLLESCR